MIVQDSKINDPDSSESNQVKRLSKGKRKAKIDAKNFKRYGHSA